MKRREILRQWLEKWYSPVAGAVSGYLFIELSVISEVVNAFKSGGSLSQFFESYRGDLLSEKTAEAAHKLLKMFSNEVFLSPLLRGDMVAIIIVELDGNKICVVGYGKEKWLCIFKTRERETKMILANLFSLLGFSERTYEFSGTRIIVDGFENWIKSLLESNEFQYAWVRNSFEAGGALPKELNLIVRAVQNLLESPFFASSLLFFLDQKSGRGVWCLRHQDEVACVFSGLGGESFIREISEVVAEVYDCYVSGLAKSGVMGEAVFSVRCEVKTESVKNVEREGIEGVEAIMPVLQPDFSEIKEALREVKEKLVALEGRVSAIESKLASSLTTSEVGDLIGRFDEKLRLIDESVTRIRDLMSDFSEKLQELRRHKSELLKAIEDLSR